MTPLCPYCGLPLHNPTEDHIYSDFLGGLRTVPACAPCNNRFGHTFEGRYSQALLRIKAWLTLSGVPLKWKREFRWKKAVDYEGAPADLVIKGGKVYVIPAAPQMVRDEHGQVVQVRARTVGEAKTITRRLMRKNMVSGVEGFQEEMSPAKVERLSFKIDAGPDLGKLCIKMCSAAATLLPEFGSEDIEAAVVALQQESGILTGAARDIRTHQRIDEMRAPLAHVIYVERNRNGTYGVVQFFGAWQFHCVLSNSSGPECAVLGALNSLTGEENFQPVDPISIPGPPAFGGDFGEIWRKRLVAQVRQLGIAGFSDLKMELLPAFRATLFAGSTTDIWPFAEIPSSKEKK